MSFNLGSAQGSSTPLQPPPSRPLYPSLNSRTPDTPSPQANQPLQQKPPPRPASVPLSFGGGLSHSASTPSLSQSFQNQDPSQQGQLQQQQQKFAPHTFSPSPQPPLTTFDLSGSSPFSKPSPIPWGQQMGGSPLGGHGLIRSHSQQFMPQPIGNPLSERRYLPSHLRSYSPERSSPLSKEPVIREPNSSPKEKRRVSFGSVTTFGHPSTSNFGGAGFGTPKDDPKAKPKREEDDLPPSASVYDFGRSSPFAKQEPQKSPSPPPDITPSLFGSALPASSSPAKPVIPTPVIIFGFPPSHSLLIIREYEKYGKILEHFSSTHSSLTSSASQPSPPPEILHGGNWIRITYADPVSAARAVATNGQIIGGAYMIGVVYAPKPQDTSATPTEMDVDSTGRRKEDSNGTSRTAPATPGGERKMNVVRGGQNMFIKKDAHQPAAAGQVGWGTWVWKNVFGEKESGSSSNNDNTAIVAGGGQSNVVVKALQGLSETVFGF